MVTVECAAMNVPAIVSKSTGCIDSIIENNTGLYCDINSISIAEKIEFMIDNEKTRRQMGLNARIHVMEMFDNTVIWPYVVKVIEA